MAQNRKYILYRIIRIQELFLLLRNKGLSGEMIYRLHIENQFGISRRTFYNYLALNARRELKEIEPEFDFTQLKTEKHVASTLYTNKITA